MNAPADTNSPCEKFKVLVVVNVTLKPSATSEYALPTARPLISACKIDSIKIPCENQQNEDFSSLCFTHALTLVVVN
jgi:hypothetical protein